MSVMVEVVVTSMVVLYVLVVVMCSGSDAVIVMVL